MDIDYSKCFLKEALEVVTEHGFYRRVSIETYRDGVIIHGLTDSQGIHIRKQYPWSQIKSIIYEEKEDPR